MVKLKKKENLEVQNEDSSISNLNTDIYNESSDDEEYHMSDEELKDFLLIGITKDDFLKMMDDLIDDTND